MHVTRTTQAIRTAVFVAAALAFAQAWGAGRGPNETGTILPRGGHVSSTNIGVSVKVVPSALLRFDQRTARVTVTEADIRRGYVDLPEDALLSVNAGSVRPLLVVDFSPSGTAFSSVKLVGTDLRTGAQRVRALNWLRDLHGAQADTLLQQYLVPGAAEQAGTVLLLSYRLTLDPGVRPGTYPVPLTVDIGL